MSGCVSIVLLDVTFVGASCDTDAQSEMQLLSARFSRRRRNAGSLLEGDPCWQSQAQLASGSPDVEGRISTCHDHICRTCGHVFPGEQTRADVLHTHGLQRTFKFYSFPCQELDKKINTSHVCTVNVKLETFSLA